MGVIRGVTIQLFKTKKEAQEECDAIRRNIYYKSRCKPIKIRFDERDYKEFGVRGLHFKGEHGKIYYIIADSKREVKSWGLHSKIL